jgi:ubiquitin carboxyl-terminal hydrolase 8
MVKSRSRQNALARPAAQPSAREAAGVETDQDAGSQQRQSPPPPVWPSTPSTPSETDSADVVHPRPRRPLPQPPPNGQRTPRAAPITISEENRSGSAPPTLPHSPLTTQRPRHHDAQATPLARQVDQDDDASAPSPDAELSMSKFSSVFPSLDQFENGYFPSVPGDDPAAVGSIGPPPTPPSFATEVAVGAASPSIGSQDLGLPPSSISVSDFVNKSESSSELPRAGPSGMKRSPKVASFGQGRPNEPVVRPSAISPSPSTRGPIKNHIDPLELYAMHKAQASVLLIDVRSREAYDRGRIFGKSVCIEPILLRNEIESKALENKLILSPAEERSIFCDRDKFDLVVIYDANSRSIPPYIQDNLDERGRALYNLHLAIYTQAFQRTLKRPPRLLIGGWEEWQRQVGAKGIVGILDLPGDAADRFGSRADRPNRASNPVGLPSAESTELS